MQDKIIEMVGNSLDDLGLWIDSVTLETENGNKYLRIALDADFMIDVNKVAEASRIIDPIVEEADLIKDAYILDIYAKSKGDGKDE